MSDEYFEYQRLLPYDPFAEQGNGLVGFDNRYASIGSSFRLLLDRPSLRAWSQKHHKRELAVCRLLDRRHQLAIFAGDVGTGKTETAEAVADRLTRELDKEGCLLKLSTRVRGKGLHGQMSALIHAGFEAVVREAGKKRLAFLLIDEADALAATRETAQMHQEEKAAVNTMIQKLDDLRSLDGRAIVMLCSNRLSALDPAIQRRAGLIVRFARPNKEERLDLLKRDLEGVGLTDRQFAELAVLTGSKSGGLGYTFSDLRLRLIPEAVARVFPNSALTFDVLRDVAAEIQPSPQLEGKD
jgi:SpoVK/Ycf46/Vps4 family AAA+-type ATPase